MLASVGRQPFAEMVSGCVKERLVMRLGYGILHRGVILNYSHTVGAYMGAWLCAGCAAKAEDSTN